ncbi:PaaI family thioesterase [Streptomyces sulphureus]|uniref:PaaI family thioesterase n=1 Tax=Streptomyces sulphureus TaxID=47758 RepID=UPI00037894DB|nr:PaaI family thioesterase [Streptomyces sulphureus]
MRTALPTPEGEAFGELVDSVRRVQAAVSASAPPLRVAQALSGRLRDAAELLEEHEVTERERLVGGAALSGPGHPILVPYELDELTERELRGTVRFSRVHLGGNGAVHGGMLPLLFDDLLGTFVSMRGLPLSRTAFLTVNYRRITPVGRLLRLEATIDAVEGRKTSVTGRLLDGDALLADAEALFVQLRPGQP